MRTRTRTIAMALAAGAVLAGCGEEKTDADRARDGLASFVQAMERRDGAAVCAALTPGAVRSVQRLARAQRRPKAGCPELVRGQLDGFRPAVGEVDVTADREVSEGRRELVSPTLARLTPDPFTLVQDAAGGDFRVALFAGEELGDRLRRSASCSRFRQTALHLPLPPRSLERYPAYLRRAARQISRRDRDLRDSFGTRVEGEALVGVARALRRAARGLEQGRDVPTAQARAESRLLQVDALVTYVAVTGGDGTHDCGPDPHQSARARAYRKRMRAPCRRAVRAIEAEGRILDGDPGLEATAASLDRMRRAFARFDRRLRAGALPDVLDAVRDDTAADLRGLQRILREEAGAIRALSLPRLTAVEARIDDAAIPADVGLARLKLRECLVPRSSLGAAAKGTAPA